MSRPTGTGPEEIERVDTESGLLLRRPSPNDAAARRVARRAGFVDQGVLPNEPGMQRLRLRRQ